MALNDDGDDQDQSESFDETLTEGDDAFGEPTNPDVTRDVYDATYALGDADDDDETAAKDADEMSDEDLDDPTSMEADEDDLDDDGADTDALSADNVADFSTDVDGPDDDAEDGVSAHGADEAEVISMGDINDLANLADGHSMSEVEPDNVSDADLKALGYASEGKD